MSLFPLYDQLISKLDRSETTLTKKYSSSITRLPQEHIVVIYLLILHHYYLRNNDINELACIKNIYNAKVGSKGKGVTFKLNQLPEDLQHIIVRYLIIISDK